jgi:heterodisulfide reductase subunit A
MPEYGYGRYDNVLTGLEVERLCSPSGPTGGEVLINDKPPSKVVFIQCVGSRDENHNPYCSRVCCMYAAKQAHLVHERAHDAEITICYMDVRAFGKGYEEFYERVQRENVLYIRGNPSEIYKKGEMLIVRGEDTLTGEAYEREADLVVLATGIVPRADSTAVAALLGINPDENGFFGEIDPQHSINSPREGVFLAGCCQSPKDIPDSVGQASGAAAKALLILSKSRKVEEVII